MSNAREVAVGIEHLAAQRAINADGGLHGYAWRRRARQRLRARIHSLKVRLGMKPMAEASGDFTKTADKSTEPQAVSSARKRRTPKTVQGKRKRARAKIVRVGDEAGLLAPQRRRPPRRDTFPDAGSFAGWVTLLARDVF